MVVQCKTFCRNPRHVFEELVMKLGFQEKDYSYSGAKRFTISRSEDVPNRKIIEKALSSFSTK